MVPPISSFPLPSYFTLPLPHHPSLQPPTTISLAPSHYLTIPRCNLLPHPSSLYLYTTLAHSIPLLHPSLTLCVYLTILHSTLNHKIPSSFSLPHHFSLQPSTSTFLTPSLYHSFSLHPSTSLFPHTIPLSQDCSYLLYLFHPSSLHLSVLQFLIPSLHLSVTHSILYLTIPHSIPPPRHS